jgi:hypothetical protein
MTRTLSTLSSAESRDRGLPATRRRTYATAAIALVLLAGCAPDAFRRDPAFEAWISEVRKECYRERIGTDTVGNLLGHSGSREGNHFLNQTSRLYAGLLTPEQWTSGVLALLSGSASDPGMRCVLDQLPKR